MRSWFPVRVAVPWPDGRKARTKGPDQKARKGRYGIGRARKDAANGCNGPFRAGPRYLAVVTSILLADTFCSAFCPTETVRMPSR